MRVRFIEDASPDDACVVFGLTFPVNQWVEVPASVFNRLSRNPAFEADTDGDGEPGPTLEELRAKCDALGIHYHHKAGVKRLLELLSETDGDVS